MWWWWIYVWCVGWVKVVWVCEEGIWVVIWVGGGVWWGGIGKEEG